MSPGNKAHNGWPGRYVISKAAVAHAINNSMFLITTNKENIIYV